MYFSKYNIFSKIKDSTKYFLMNPLTRNAHLLNAEETAALKNGKLAGEGYFFKDENEERKLYKQAYLDFLDMQEDSETQIFFVPTYACNFACSYCYQDEYSDHANMADKEIIDAFYQYIDSHFAGVKKYITIFGGEPLLPGDQVRQNITYLLEKAQERTLGVALVTNGYTLTDYVDLLKNYKIKEIQVTLDGLEKVHNQRRPLKGGKGSFKRIIKGIDQALQNNLPVNLRLVLDKENIKELPGFARFAIKKGWTKSPFFQSQLGRNYELHHCQEKSQSLYTRIEMYKAIY
ncbi:MAG: radical SAM protein, partial [Spirochaetes bacterium]|nr:radical SAM protein [Spirochaetota bacterium]